jgi:foldase protein PrsA
MGNTKLLWGLVGCLILLLAVLGWKYNQVIGQNTIASVGDITINEAELADELKKKYGQLVLERMIDKQVVFLQAKKMGLSISDDELDRELKKVKDRYVNAETFLQVIKQDTGLTSDEMKEDLRYYLLLEKIATMDIEISDNVAFGYYEQNRHKYNRPPMAKISAIFLETSDEAKQVVNELKKGANFSTLAKERSVDIYSSANGGELGWISLLNGGEDADQELIDAALKLEIGKVSEPISLERGFAVIEIKEKKAPVQRSFEQVQDEIKRDIALQEAGSLEDVLKQLKMGLDVEVYSYQ